MIKFMKFIFFILGFSTFSLITYSQNSISGFVYDKETGEALIGASIRADIGNGGTTTDNNGYFYIKNLSQGTTSISFSCVGYERENRVLKTIIDRQVHIYLNKGVLINEVIVAGNAIEHTSPGIVSLSTQQIKLIPNLTGEADILKAFQLLPGVQSGSEGSVSLIVRGGTNDQNIYLLDDVPLYYVNHIGGFVSIFDASAIKAATLYKGFFPASYGGRLSSVMDVRLKDGDLNSSKKELMIGTLTSKFFCEGPFKNNRTTYMVSARFCNLGLYTAINDDLNYYFYDLNTKFSHRIDRNNKLLFTIYSGIDSYKVNDNVEEVDRNIKCQNSYNFGNHMVNLKWISVLSPFLSSNITASCTNFINRSVIENKTNLSDVQTETKEVLSSYINDFQIKSDLSFLKFSKHAIRFGSVTTLQLFRPLVYSFKQKDEVIISDTTITNKINALQNGLYIEDKWDIHNNVLLTAGLRLSTFAPLHNKNYSNFEPRISTRIEFNNHLSVNIGYSRMAQYIHLLSNNDGGIPKDLWVPSTEKIHPETSDQYEIEVCYELSRNLLFKANLYYKELKGLIDYKENIPSFQYWEDAVETNGKGINKGIEFMVVKEKGKINGYISYVLSKSSRQFDGINNGKEYPFRYDHRNQANIVLNYSITKKLTLVATWTYHTGNAITMAYEKYQIINGGYAEGQYGEAHVYNGRNGFRMPDYHRLDLGLSIKRNKGEWHLGIYNAYNRMNPYYYYLSLQGDSYVLKQKVMFPIIPSVSYSYYF